MASQLLSEKEHGEIIELVNTMIDYAIIYKKGKVLSPNGTQMQDSTLDSLGLCFDPPIHDFVNFQVWASALYCASSVKIVVYIRILVGPYF